MHERAEKRTPTPTSADVDVADAPDRDPGLTRKQTIPPASAGDAVHAPRIVSADAAPVELWRHLWENSTQATFSESPWWAQIWSEYSGGAMAPEPALITFDDGSRAVLPLTRQTHHRVLTRYLLAPAGTYGGWLSDDLLDERRARLLAEWLLAERAPLWWRPNPFDPLTDSLRALATDSRDDVTHVMPLPEGAESQLRHRGHRMAVNKARRAGLTVRRATDEQDWQRYLAVYDDTVRRWGEGGMVYRPELFERLRVVGGKRVELWLVETAEGQTVAGAINLLGHRHVAGWHMVSLKEYHPARPTNLLVHDCVVDAAKRGYAWFDMHPSGGLEGVAAFKEHCGGVTRPSPVVVIGPDPAARAAEHVLGALGRARRLGSSA